MIDRWSHSIILLFLLSFKETFFYTESTTVNPNSTNSQSKILRIGLQRRNSSFLDPSTTISTTSTPVIVTRTLSTSNVRNASATIVQTATPGALTSSSNPSSVGFPHHYPRSIHRNSSSSSSPSVGILPTYHPITTELWIESNPSPIIRLIVQSVFLTHVQRISLHTRLFLQSFSFNYNSFLSLSTFVFVHCSVYKENLTDLSYLSRFFFNLYK